MADFQTLLTPKGFSAAGLACGIKSSGTNDIALFATRHSGYLAAIFTTNKMKAAPIRVSIDHMARTSSTARAILVSSGNANAATGPMGIEVARVMCKEVAGVLGCQQEEVVIAQTGLIGVHLNHEVVGIGSANVAKQISNSSWEEAARGMMTTDTYPKCASRQFEIEGKVVTVTGIGKGVAMAAPAMATMIVVLLTDAACSNAVLQSCLRSAADDSFHQLNIDGCRSTNDTVFLLANGESGAPLITFTTPEPRAMLQAALGEVCEDLARQMAGDAEGRNKFVTVEVRGALLKEEARRAARQVVGSVLVKCAIAGECPYWGRVIAEIGASGVTINPEDISIYFGDHLVCDKSMATPFDRERVMEYMRGKEIDIIVDLHQGTAKARAFGSDLTHEYLKINMEKS